MRGSITFPDGTEFSGELLAPLTETVRIGGDAQVALQPAGPWTRYRPLTARLRRELRNSGVAKRRKNRVWAFLQHRRATR